MNELKVFSNPDFGEVRTTTIDNEPWFVVADVCAYFGVTNRNRIMQTVDAEDKGGTQIDTPGGMQTVAIVNESGLYSVLFALQPTKARGVSKEYIEERQKKLNAFKRWITHDVIPSIRKHGAYMTPETLEAAMLNPHFVRKLCDQLIESQGKCKELEATNSALTVENQILLPKASYFDQLVDRNTLTNFRETAKALNVAPKAFVSFLLEKKYLYRDKKGKLLPYENRNEGLFEVKECYNEKTQWGGTQTLVTPKGRETFRLLYVGA